MKLKEEGVLKKKTSEVDSKKDKNKKGKETKDNKEHKKENINKQIKKINKQIKSIDKQIQNIDKQIENEETNKNISGQVMKKKVMSIMKQIVIIALFFIACYISMELINGRTIQLDEVKDTTLEFSERKEALFDILKFFFEPEKFLYNYAIFILLFFILYGITKKRKVSCTTIYVCTVLFGVINYIVRQVRGSAITISDIFSIGTAASVLKGIRPEFDGNIYTGLIIFFTTIILFWIYVKFEDISNAKNIKRRVTMVFIGITGFAYLLISNSYIKEVSIWNTDDFGANVVLVRMIKDLKIDRPKNYTKNSYNNILKEYEDETENYEGRTPNIIVIVDESFADFEKIFNIDLPQDSIPFFYSLQDEENVISGLMHSSEFGGGTANVEYEFLTQNTTAFLPSGSIPYQQYIRKNINQSIVTYLNNLGYNTYGMHPFYGSGYSRSKIYKFLQFKNKMFIDDFEEIVYDMNNYPSDLSAFNNWFKIMDNKPEKEKNFTFLLTMQNHLPYIFVDSEGEQYSEDFELNSYLQALRSSDKALEQVVNYIKNYEEDTILLFFGDHEPKITAMENYEHKSEFSDEEANYITPFIMFANFDIEEKKNVETSTNYLQSMLIEEAEMPKNSYTNYISKLRDEIPVITTQYYKDKNEKMYMVDDVTSPYYNKVQEYWTLIYSQLFAK